MTKVNMTIGKPCFQIQNQQTEKLGNAAIPRSEPREMLGGFPTVEIEARYGNVQSKRFKKEMGKLYAFRHEIDNRQIRFPCFQDGNRWILTHGFIKPGAQKKKGKWPQGEIDRAGSIGAEYFRRKKLIVGDPPGS